MEKGYTGSRQNDLKRSFNLGVHALLTTCSNRTSAKHFQDLLRQSKKVSIGYIFRLLWLCIRILRMNLKFLSQETKVGNILDTVEELVEEHTMGPLYFDKTDLNDVEQVLSTLKKNEIKNLTIMLEKSEAQHKVFRTRVELLQKELRDPSVTSNALEKAKTGMLNNGTSNTTNP